MESYDYVGTPYIILDEDDYWVVCIIYKIENSYIASYKICFYYVSIKTIVFLLRNLNKYQIGGERTNINALTYIWRTLHVS